MKTRRHLPLLVFSLLMVLLAITLSARWSVAEAGYIDEPAGVIEDTPTGGVLLLGESGNGSVAFSDCTGKCIVKDGLPTYAKDALDEIDGNIVNKVYIRTVNSNGLPVDASYTICFDSPGTLMEYVIGTGWVAVAGNSQPGTEVCHEASGEGVFVFVR